MRTPRAVKTRAPRAAAYLTAAAVVAAACESWPERGVQQPLGTPGAARTTLPPPGPDRPFHRLDTNYAGTTYGVTTSRDEYSISIHWFANDFRIRYPDGRREFTPDWPTDQRLDASLALTCRADGSRTGHAGAVATTSWLQLPMHPEAPDVHDVTDAEYWILGVRGRGTEEIPVQVAIDGRHVDGRLVRRLTAYANPRPVVRIHMAPEAAISLLEKGASNTIAVQGKGTAATIELPAVPNVRRAAEAARAYCPHLPETSEGP